MCNKTEENGETERISSQNQCKKDEVRCLLDATSAFARRVLESIQAVAGTTAVKGVQIARLERFAKENGCWIEDINQIGTFSDRGSENEVYLPVGNETTVYKLNDFRYSDDNLFPFFERIKAHNHYFSDCPYQLIGFSRNQSGKVCALLSQPFIIARREATEIEIKEELLKIQKFITQI